MTINGKDIFMGAYEAFRPKPDVATLKDVDEGIKANVTKNLNAAIKELNPFQHSSATLSISQETVDFFASEAFYERVQKDSELLYSSFLDRQQALAAEKGGDSPFWENSASQWLVFSQQLYDNGFYDGMDIDEVAEKENLLKLITMGMDNIGNQLYKTRLPNVNDVELYRDNNLYMTSAEAWLDLASSTSALKYFADKFLEGDMRQQFHELAERYNQHNRDILPDYRNINESFAHNLHTLNRDYHGGAIHPKALPDTKHYLQLGGIRHTEEEKAGFHLNVGALFERFRLGGGTDATFFQTLKDTYLDFATNNSADKGFKDYVARQSADIFGRVGAYWARVV